MVYKTLYFWLSIPEKMSYKVKKKGQNKAVFCRKTCQILDPFSSYPVFLAEFWCVLQESSASWKNCDDTRKILVKAIKRTRNTSWKVFFKLIYSPGKMPNFSFQAGGEQIIWRTPTFDWFWLFQVDSYFQEQWSYSSIPFIICIQKA